MQVHAGIPDLIAGNERLKKASDKTTQEFAARHGG
jgi:hypothetical protein